LLQFLLPTTPGAILSILSTQSLHLKSQSSYLYKVRARTSPPKSKPKAEVAPFWKAPLDGVIELEAEAEPVPLAEELFPLLVAVAEELLVEVDLLELVEELPVALALAADPVEEALVALALEATAVVVLSAEVLSTVVEAAALLVAAEEAAAVDDDPVPVETS